MNWPNRALFFVNVCLFAGIGWLYAVNAGHAPQQGLDWKDYAAILLTVVTIILASVGLFVAVSAIWGYTTIRQHAEDTARKTAAEIATKTAAKVARAVATREALAADQLASEATPEETDALSALLMEGNGGTEGGERGSH